MRKLLSGLMDLSSDMISQIYSEIKASTMLFRMWEDTSTSPIRLLPERSPKDNSYPILGLKLTDTNPPSSPTPPWRLMSYEVGVSYQWRPLSDASCPNTNGES